jgi:hypothetical protein
MRIPQTRRAVSATLALLLAGTIAIAANPDSRPFKVTLIGNANPMPTADPCVLDNNEAGTGHATHMGNITFATHETVNMCTNPDGADVDGTFLLTAANGDTVFGTYHTLAHLDFGTNQVSAFGQFTITGGTGRFEGASGDGTIGADGSLLPPFEVLGGQVGRISY